MRNPGSFVAANLLGAIFFVTACTDNGAGASISAATFRHGVATSQKPWTNAKFDVEDNKFTFAVFSDLTGDEREHIFEIAIEQLALLRPELIINVGDLIEGGTENLGEIESQWMSFDERADRASAPIFYVGGNHDLTGEVLQGVWDERYGRRYYHFVYKDVLYLVLDTEDHTRERMQEIFVARNKALDIVRNEGWEKFSQTEYANMPEQAAGTIGDDQFRYMQRVIAENDEVRWTFLFMHKAPWQREDEKNFAAIEQALSDRPYTVFHGHVHAYLHEERLGRDYIRLATTGGVQFPEKDLSIDHITLVTVSGMGVDIANLRMSGIFDKTGRIPLGGEALCFDATNCVGQISD